MASITTTTTTTSVSIGSIPHGTPDLERIRYGTVNHFYLPPALSTTIDDIEDAVNHCLSTEVRKEYFAFKQRKGAIATWKTTYHDTRVYHDQWSIFQEEPAEASVTLIRVFYDTTNDKFFLEAYYHGGDRFWFESLFEVLRNNLAHSVKTN